MSKLISIAARPSLKGFIGCALALVAGFAAPALQAQVPAVIAYGSRLAALPNSTTGTVTKVARDAAGNIYFLTTTPAVYEIPVNGPQQVVVPSTDASFTALGAGDTMTVDPAGDIFLTRTANNSFNGIYKIPRNANGTYNYAGETNIATLNTATLTNGDYAGSDIAVDGDGNIYVGSNGGNTVGSWKGLGILMVGPAAPAGKYLLISTVGVRSLTIDAAGDLFYVDGTNAWEIPAAMVQADTTITPVQIGSTTSGNCTGCTALTTPGYIYLDQASDIYVGNGTNLFLLPNTGAAFSSTSPSYALSNAFIKSVTYGAVDNNGSIFAPYSGSLEFYGGGKYYQGSPSVGSTIAVGVTSNTGYANPSLLFTFTQTVTLGATFEAALGYGSANGGAGPAQTIYGTNYNTCTASTTYAAGSSCTAELGYNVKDPGSFSGALVLYGCPSSSTGTCSSGTTSSVLTTVTGTSLATGAAVTVDTGVATTVGTGYLAPAGVAVDNTGASYVADPASNTVFKYVAGSTAAGTAIATGTTAFSGGVAGLSGPSGVTLDQGGNLYIADTGNDRIVVVPNSTTGLVVGSASVLATTGYALSSPKGLAVDSFGNLLISDTGNARILEVANPFANALGTKPTVITSALTAPYGIAVDPYNNLFIADKGANAVYEIPTALLTVSATAGVGSGALTAVGSGFVSPTGVATDGSGSVYIADSGNKRIVKIPSESGVLTPADQVVLYSGLNVPYGIATDLTADIYFTDAGTPTLSYMQRSSVSGSTAATLGFGAVAISATGSQNAIVSNAGLTTSLTFGATAVSTPAAPFAQTSSACANSGILAPGKSCTIGLSYSPTAAGASTSAFVVTDNALAVTTATQHITLTGVGSGTVASTTLTGASTAVYGDDVTFTVTAKDASGNPSVAGNGTYTVAITNSGNPAGSATVNVSGGKGTFFLPSLGVGTYSLSVTVGGFAGTASITLTAAPLYLTATNVTRLFNVANPALGAVYSGFANGDTASVVTGTATVATAATRVSPYGTYPITVSGTLTAANYTITLVSGVLSVTGSVPQTIVFPALPNFTHGTVVTLTGQSTSGLPITYTVTGGSVAGSTLTIGAAGTVTVIATQFGNNTYAGATSVTRTFTAQ